MRKEGNGDMSNIHVCNKAPYKFTMASLLHSQQLHSHCNCSKTKGIFALAHQVKNTLGHGYALPFGQLTLGGHGEEFCLSREAVFCVVVHQEMLV